MRYAIAIDVGIRNLGLCVYDFISTKIVYWDNIPLMTGRYIPSNNVLYVRDFVRRFRHYFDEAATVIIERQMRCNMRIIEALLQSFFYDICIIINPRSVKMHYGTSRGDYRLNKSAAVDWATLFVEKNPTAFSQSTSAAFEVKGAKKDDLADSLLLILYYLDTYSNQLSAQ
jgi:hypothetical protein